MLLKRKLFKSFSLILVLLCILTSFIPSVCASEVPYESYTYWSVTKDKRKAVKNRPMYEVKTVIEASDIGVADFEKLNDVCTDSKGNTYLLDNQSRIIMLDNEYNFISELSEIKSDNDVLTFVGARSLYVHSDGTLYICDTDNQRVIHCDSRGNLLHTIFLPKSSLIPDDFIYRPLKVVVDSYNYIYVLSDGSYYGALMYDENQNFLGFYGANKVKGGILSAFESIKKRLFTSDAKRSASARKLPYCFVDIVIDDEDFIYTATGYTEKYSLAAQIKRLNPGNGNNILDSEEVNFVDDDINYTYKLDGTYDQNLQGVAVDKDGFIYGLDATYGRVFLYDAECNMVTAFGGGMGSGSQNGTFVSASAIDLNSEDVIVCDSSNNSLTVFTINEYGRKVLDLIKLTINGDYLEAKQGWEEVLKQDNNLQLAYSGLAKAYFAEKDYDNALKYAKEGYDRDTYALAFEFTRKQFLSDNFFFIFFGVIIILAAIVALCVVNKKKKLNVIKNGNIKQAFNSLVHPALVFEDIAYKKTGSLVISIVILISFYVASVCEVIFGGFIYSDYDPETFNSLLVLLRSVGFVVLWIISNWLICSLLGGLGRLREIIIVTCYSLMPIVFSSVITLVLSNVLLPTETVFLSILQTIALIYAGLMLVNGMIKIHDFSMPRFIGTTLLSIFGMAAIIFLIIMLVILLQQFGGFLSTLFVELLI